MDSELDQILLNSIAESVPIKLIDFKGMFVPDSYSTIAEAIENFEVRDDDIWVCSFPRSGTTWSQEMVWCIGNDLNFEAAKIPLYERFPYLEFTGALTLGWISVNNPQLAFPDVISRSVEYADKVASPRFIKTHLPFYLLPRQLRTGEKKPKIIYVTRNPKDVCISYYHYYKLYEAYCGTFDNYCKLFLGNKVYYAPYWEHVIGYWKRKHDGNILYLKYEDMKADLSSAIKKTATFLGKSLEDQQVKDLESHLNFANMKENSAVNGWYYKKINEMKLYGENFICKGDFIRKGETGQWKTIMSKELIKQFDDWIAENLLNFKDLSNEFSYILNLQK